MRARAWAGVVLCGLAGLTGCSAGSGGGSQQPGATAPTANAGGPYTTAFGTAIVFNGAASSDPQGQTLIYRWNFGDNTTGSGAGPSHTYATAGMYTVTLTVTNTSGLAGTATAKATVAVPPIANAGGPYSAALGTAISFNGAGSSDPQSQSLSYAWDFGDHTTATGASATHTYAAVGAYTVTLTVTDTSGLIGTATVTATVTNGTHITEITTPVKHIVWDAAHGVFYATLPSTATNANAVVPINPVTGTVGTPAVAGSNPDVMAISDDDSLLYVALDGSSSIVRFNLPALTLDPNFNLAMPSGGFGSQTTVAMAVAPGSPHTIAAMLGTYAVSPNSVGGTVIYDDATARIAKIGYTTEFGSTSLAWGGNASALYETDASSDGTLWVNTVNSSGITLATAYGGEMESQMGTLHFDSTSGYVYSDDGRVVNPANGNLVGTFNVSSIGFGARYCLPDIANNVVFFLGQTYSQVPSFTQTAPGVTLLAFNATTFQLINTLPISTTNGYPAEFIRWGSAGLAFTIVQQYTSQPTQFGPIYLLDGNFVSTTAAPDFTSGTSVAPLPNLVSISPQTAAAGSSGLSLNVSGSNFQPSSSVLWNGTPLVTNVLSASSLQATVPSSALTAAGTAVVTVSNGTNNLSAGSLAFTITPASPGTTNLLAVNLASLDIAWHSAGNQLIAPVWNADPQFANSIVCINPATGIVTNSVSVAADPTMARITSDGGYVYTGFKTVNQVTQLALPSLTAPTSFSLGIAPNGDGPWIALDVQPAPGVPFTTAVLLNSLDGSPVVIYDSGIQRLSAVPDYTNLIDCLQWSSNTSTLYASGNNGTLALYALAVNSAGVTLTNTDPNTFGASGSKMHFDSTTGYVYDDDGQVVNPATYAQVGKFGASGLLAVDSTLGRVFILGQTVAQSGTTNYTIQSFNQTTFAAVNSISISGVVGTPVAFTRWGTNGLAFVTYNKNASPSGGPAGMLYIISDTGFVK